MTSLKRIILIVGFAVTAAAALVIGCNLAVGRQSCATYDQAALVPSNQVGVVLGCKRWLGGYENPFFRSRIEAAASLFQAGRVHYLLVSGDNHRQGYDEASDMKQALVELGIPNEKIVCDYAGFTTLDSMVRAQKVFQQSSITVISQKFHNERAIYLAKGYGIDAVGYNAPSIKLKWAFKTYVREMASRVKAVWDVNMTHRQPKFLGEPVLVGETVPENPVCS